MKKILDILRGIFDDYLAKVIIIVCALMITINFYSGDMDAMFGWISLLSINLVLYGVTSKFGEN